MLNSHYPKYKLAIFDIDETLLDTTEYVIQSFEDTLEAHNLPARREKIEPLIGKYVADIYQQLAPSVDFSKLHPTHMSFQISNAHLAVPYAATPHTLRSLKEKGIHITAFTNRDVQSAAQTLRSSGIAGVIDILISGEWLRYLKPHPEGIRKAIKHYGIAQKDVIMIGDTDVDILAGKRAGVATIGVTYGFYGKKIAKMQPDFVVDDISQVLPIILGSQQVN